MENTYEKQITEIIETLELNNETERSILKSRFLGEVLQYESRKNNTKKYYNMFRFLVTSGSILLPAVLSMGQMDPAKLPKNFDNISYWTSWTISLMVTACNGFLQLFSLDKNYFEFSITTEQLKTEGWQFFQLSGKYEDYDSHKEAYKPFCKSVENIKRKQIEKEFPGKADVNKGKKDKKFNFEEELLKSLPSKFGGKEKELEQKMDAIMGLIENKKNQMDDLIDLEDPKDDDQIQIVDKSSEKQQDKEPQKPPEKPAEKPKTKSVEDI
tara:strand:- start:922 stop:1728 length:807 start_codon:yes stop_codon:yes gene_type:complete